MMMTTMCFKCGLILTMCLTSGTLLKYWNLEGLCESTEIFDSTCRRFLHSLGVSKLEFALVCRLSSTSKGGQQKLYKLIRTAGNVAGGDLEASVSVMDSRPPDKLLFIISSQSFTPTSLDFSPDCPPTDSSSTEHHTISSSCTKSSFCYCNTYIFYILMN